MAVLTLLALLLGTAAATPAVAAQAQAAATGSFAGRVLAPAGVPVSQVRVQLYDPFCVPRYGCALQAGRSVPVKADGTFRVTGLEAPAPGEASEHHYRVVDPTRRLVDHPFGETAQLAAVEVRAGKTTTLAPIRLQLAGSIRGRAVGRVAGHVPSVAAYRRVAGVGGAAPTWEYAGTANVPTDVGPFVMDGLPAGTYRLKMIDNNDFTEKWYPNATTVERARDVVVVAGRSAGPLAMQMGTVAPKVNVRHQPQLKGRAKVGRKLRVVTGLTEPVRVTTRYRWYLRSKGRTVRIKGATTAQLRLKKRWAGKKVKVKVTASVPGHRSTSVTSAWSARIAR